ncbi:DUF5368 domain-containing protein [Rhodophyticola porphyridii]|uniref:DUF5368 domain-containing protein n=1 Tax=Rhodophyticola porphyridii TaxID=1852017 RepID=A0A3L9Y0M4_9RHOB|nr:DUF5368 domain-containing protein [Rhodophyticola porphyridii]RMA42374.1 hypothetical protein D9R08_09750 [Rhodophyticola porphyridii]
MENPTIGTFIAVFEEMFGRGLFWGLVVLAVVITLAYIFVLIRDRSVSWRKFLLAQLFMPIGAVAAVWFVFAITKSHLRDIGGPIDLILVLGIATLGAVGAAILVYTVQSVLKGPGPAE